MSPWRIGCASLAGAFVLAWAAYAVSARSGREGENSVWETILSLLVWGLGAFGLLVLVGGFVWGLLLVLNRDRRA